MRALLLTLLGIVMALTNIASVDAASEEDSVRKVVADFGGLRCSWRWVRREVGRVTRRTRSRCTMFSYV